MHLEFQVRITAPQKPTPAFFAEELEVYPRQTWHGRLRFNVRVKCRRKNSRRAEGTDNKELGIETEGKKSCSVQRVLVSGVKVGLSKAGGCCRSKSNATLETASISRLSRPLPSPFPVSSLVVVLVLRSWGFRKGALEVRIRWCFSCKLMLSIQ
ncbi:hypothetical protein MLD38_015932 [Melastoma candidum]|uniref:Uncharacterized protein n=1 Tax=Melastoma candidum TaxID=119954 RepID=A0ACB9RLE9_9MYRT|nr:hypothetical protein MLD38_015932 [Melastoma candidum]